MLTKQNVRRLTQLADDLDSNKYTKCKFKLRDAKQIQFGVQYCYCVTGLALERYRKNMKIPINKYNQLSRSLFSDYYGRNFAIDGFSVEVLLSSGFISSGFILPASLVALNDNTTLTFPRFAQLVRLFIMLGGPPVITLKDLRESGLEDLTFSFR